MGQWTVKCLRRVEPETRLHIASYLFWISIVLGAISTAFIAKGGFEKILMAISWGAITITCVDVILMADVRDNE